MPEWPEPQPTDGPEFHAEHTFWRDAQARRKQLAKQGDDTVPRTFAPDFTRVSTMAREVARRMEARLAGMPVHLSRFLEHAAVSVDPGTGAGVIFLPQHNAEAEAAMSAELVACTLGQRDRPELLPRDPWSVDHAALP